MLGNFIKLTDVDDFAIYVNSTMIIAVEIGHSNGSKIQMMMSERYLHVKESPSEVIKLIKSGNKMYL